HALSAPEGALGNPRRLPRAQGSGKEGSPRDALLSLSPGPSAERSSRGQQPVSTHSLRIRSKGSGRSGRARSHSRIPNTNEATSAHPAPAGGELLSDSRPPRHPS